LKVESKYIDTGMGGCCTLAKTRKIIGYARALRGSRAISLGLVRRCSGALLAFVGRGGLYRAFSSYNDLMTDNAMPTPSDATPLSSVRLVGFSARDNDLLKLFLRRPPGSGTTLHVVDDENADLLIANLSQADARAVLKARNRPDRSIGIVNQFASDAAFYQVQQNSQLLYSLAQGITRIREGWMPPHLVATNAGATLPAPAAEHGTAVNSESAPDASAHFSLAAIPVTAAAATTADTVAANAEPAPADTPQLSGAAGLPWQRSLSILVVDDSNFSRVAIQEALGKVGFAVDTAINGEDGLRMATAKGYDVALVDFEMPGIKGPEVIRRMRSLGANTPQLLIMLTSRTGTVDRLRAKIAGCDAYLTKPTKMSEFVSVLTQFATQGRLKRN
jgi:CheY-like chemotaxis protein